MATLTHGKLRMTIRRMKKPTMPNSPKPGSPWSKFVTVMMVIAICPLLLTGCASTAKKPKIQNDTKVNVVVTTEDVLFRSNVVNEGGVKGTANRIYKETLRALDERGIKTTAEGGSGQPKLTVEITTIETVTKHRPGPFFSTIVRQDVKIVFLATLVSTDGTTLFRVDGRKADESLDGVTKTIGRYLAKQVAKHHE